LTTTTYYQVVIKSTLNGVPCSAISNLITVTINNISPSVIVSNQTICSGGDPTAFTVTTPATGTGALSYQWQSSTTSAAAGFSDIAGATNTTYDAPSGLTTTTYYQVVIKSTLNGVPCSATSNVLTVTINNVSAGVLSQTQTICSAGDAAAFTVSTAASGSGLLSYQWQSSTISNSTGFSDIPGATLSTYDPPAGQTLTTYFRLIVTSALNSIACTSTSALLTVFVNNVSPSVIASNQTICSGGDPTAFTVTTPATGTGALSYQWQSSTTSNIVGFTNITGATSANYDAPSGLTTTTYYQVVSTSTLNGVPCSATSNVIIVTINNVSAGVLSQTQTICSGGNPAAFTATTAATGTGILSYQWQSSTISAVGGFTDIVGATNSTYDPPAGQTLTTYFRLIVTSTLNSITCTSPSAVLTVFVNNVSPSVIANDQTICSGGNPAAFTATTAATGTGALSYQWQSSTTSNIAGFSDILGATNATYDAPSGLTTTTYYQVVIKSTLNGVPCSAISNVITVTINNVSPSVIASNQSICSGGDPTAFTATPATGTGTLSYQWQSSTTNTAGSFTNIAGATSATYDAPNGLTTTTYYQVIITSTLNGVPCSATSNVLTVTINNVSAGVLSQTQTICSAGDAAAFTVSTTASGSGLLSYQWQSSTSSNIAGFSDILGATLSTYDPPAGQTLTTYFRLIVTSALNSIACTSTSAVLTVFVNNVSPSVIANDQTICSGGNPAAFTATTAATGTGALSYQWQSSTTNTAGSFTNIAGATSATYDAPSGLTTTTYYQVVITSTLNGVPCSATSNVLNVYVNLLPILTIPSVVTICNNQTVNLNLTASNNSSFVWNAQNNNSVSGESILPQTSTIINDLLTNNTTSIQYLTYTITPTSSPEGCIGAASSLTVQVQPNVLLNIPQNLEICSGSAVNAVLNANVSSNFQWFVSINNPNVNGESLINNTSNIISDILINNTTTNQVVIYSVFPISVLGICNGQAQTITIIVKPQLALLNTDTLTICSNESVNLNLVANTNVTLNWYADQSLNVINETTSVTTSSIINDVLINSTGQVQEVTYNVTGTSTIDGCSTPIIPITVFVNPLPTVNPSADLNLCVDIVTNPILFTGNVIGSVYSWATTSLNLGIPTLTGINSIPSFSTTNSGLTPISSIVEVTPIFINNNIQCEGPIDQFTITVNPVPSVFPVSNIILCEGELSSSVILLGTLGGTIFNWVNSNVSVGLASPGTGNIPVFTAQNPTLLPIQSTITVTPLYGLAQCPGDDILFDITVKPAPTINPQTVSICSGETLDINLSADLPCTFQWFATPNLNVLNETYTPTQNTDIIYDILVQTTTIPQTVQYNISAISTQYNCESSSIVFNVIVNPLPVPSFTILNPPFCDLSPISFQNNTTGILDFTWSFGDGLYSNLYSPSHQFPTFGSYDVQLNAINPQTLCTNNIMNQIIISPTPSAVFSYSDSLGCDVLDVTYTAVSSNPTWGYLWDFGNGETLQQASSVGYQFDLEGCYDVSLTVTNNNGCTATQLYTDIACVYESPIASFSTDQDVLNEIDPLVSFYNNSVNASSFEWEFGDGTNSFAENPIHTYPDDAASYLVTLVAYNEISCTDSASIRIIILKDVGLYVPNSFTPDGDEYNHTFYPILTEGFKKDSYHMSIFDRWGELVFETYDPSFGWNGNYRKNGIQCQIGTYTWVIELIELQSAVNRKFNGHLNLIR
jgi:gliding motility-associated-like protein